eukprot:178041-Pleurochrysis_carterae.AAC.1
MSATSRRGPPPPLCGAICWARACAALRLVRCSTSAKRAWPQRMRTSPSRASAGSLTHRGVAWRERGEVRHQHRLQLYISL